MALNIVSYINEAYIDQAAVKAGTLKVLAQMPEKEIKEDKETEDEETEDKWVKNLVTGLVTEAADKMGLKDLFGEENTEKLTRLLAGTADQVVTVAKTTMLKGTPLEGMKLEDIRNNPENLLKFRELIGSNITEILKTNAKTTLSELGRVLTTAALDGLFTWLDVDVKEIERNPSNVFVTEAVSGAGASNVGVAGSVAIAVINGTTKAYIGDSANVITATGDIIINADARQSESTTGSAAVGNDGKADKNLSGGN